MLKTICCLTLPLLIPASYVQSADTADVSISQATRDDDGVLVHVIESPYQDGKTTVRVLLPEAANNDKRLPVIYLLPVEALDEHRYGQGLVEVRKLDLHNKHQAIFVAPTFAHLPWYADHPTNLRIRQETYFLRVVVPLIDKAYPARAEPAGRLLLGFSKSGWGAFSLLLRNPKLFGRAVAWDAPLMMEQPNRFGMGDIFGTQECFDGYQISKLLRERAETLRTGESRLISLGYGNFREHHERSHALLDELRIPHLYRDGPSRKHDWHSGWVGEGVTLLLSNSESEIRNRWERSR